MGRQAAGLWGPVSHPEGGLTNTSGFGHAEHVPRDPVAEIFEIAGLVSDEMAQVETAFRENLATPLSIVNEIGEFVSDGGGKRLRPMLHLLCARLCGYQGPNSILLATVLEYIHCATLIHDDIIDEATTRRGRKSVNYRWGNNITVLFGDHLLAKAMDMALRARSLRVMEKLAEVTLRMTEGEMLQTRYVGRLDLTEVEYLDLVERKTAALFACCCELAAELSTVDEKHSSALHGYGVNLGMAFQIVDDLLDFTGDPRALGKPAVSDLREGKATLPVIDLLSSGSTEIRALVQRAMDSDSSTSSAIVELSTKLHESGAIDRAYARAEAYAAAAITQIERFEDGPYRRALLALPDLLIHRDR
jgi:octaprenyl-diphosphate synthase